VQIYILCGTFDSNKDMAVAKEKNRCQLLIDLDKYHNASVLHSPVNGL